eukprot:11098664-Alexandrium_andersonii.AAC.1
MQDQGRRNPTAGVQQAITFGAAIEAARPPPVTAFGPNNIVMPPPPPAPFAMVQAPPAERHTDRRAQQPTFLQLAGLATGVPQMP